MSTLVATFINGCSSIVKEADKHTLKYGGQKALGFISGVICEYFGSASSILIIKSAKIFHSVFSGVLNVVEFCASTPINMLEIKIFGRPVIIEDEGFDLFSENPDPLNAVEKLLKK